VSSRLEEPKPETREEEQSEYQIIPSKKKALAIEIREPMEETAFQIRKLSG